MSFEDKTLVCRDCGTAFTFTAGEQEFYEQKGFTNEPQRCRNCRQARKQQRGGGNPSNERSFADTPRNDSYSRGNDYGNYRRGNDYGGQGRGNDYGYRNDRGMGQRRDNDYGSGGYGYERRERVQHETVCAQCGRVTTVPFVPRAGRPVYCQECFAERRSTVPSGGYNRF